MEPLFLTLAFEDLDLPEEIKKFMATHKISSLKQLLEIKKVELLKMEGFSYRMLQSLLAFLNDHDSLHLFTHD